MNAADYARLQLGQAFGLLNVVAKGLDEAQYNWEPGGTCNAIAKTHVHALTSLDFFLNGVLQGKPAIWQSFAAEHAMPANPLEIWTYVGDVALPAIAGYGVEVQSRRLSTSRRSSTRTWTARSIRDSSARGRSRSSSNSPTCTRPATRARWRL